MADGSSSSSCNVLNRIIRKINKRRRKRVSKFINTRKNTTCWEDEEFPEELIDACVQDLGMLLDYNRNKNTTIDDIDAKMNTLVLLDHDDKKQQSSTWLQQLADYGLQQVLPADDAFPQYLDDMLLDFNNTTTTATTTTSGTSNGDEDLMSSQQQQQQQLQPPPVPTSEGEEDNYLSALLWPLDFQIDDDYQQIDNLYPSSLDQIKEFLEICG